jgi:hypothetical protein
MAWTALTGPPALQEQGPSHLAWVICKATREFTMNGVLVYPYFFAPSDWLKLAALCWDTGPPRLMPGVRQNWLRQAP